jgi:hypothetical protein
VEVTPVVIEMGPVIGVTISVAVAAAMKDRRRAKTTTPEHRRSAEATAVNRTASEPAAMKCRAAASEASTMKRRAAAPKTSTVKSAATKTAAAAVAAMLNLGRQSVGCVFC